jgi:c-di-AMP phosphodiesterase-like protein
MDLLLDIGLYLTYALAAIAVLGMLFFAVWQIIAQIAYAPKSAIKIIVLLVIAVIVLFAAYFLSSNYINDDPAFTSTILEKTGTASGWVKLTGAGLLTTYFFGIIAIIAWIATSIYVKVRK